MTPTLTPTIPDTEDRPLIFWEGRELWLLDYDDEPEPVQFWMFDSDCPECCWVMSERSGLLWVAVTRLRRSYRAT